MAGVLAMAGAHPPIDPLPAAPDNERGFWESESVVALNDRVLEALGSGWDDVFAGARQLDPSTADLTFHIQAETLVDTVFERADLLVLKDPRVSLLCPFWRSVLIARGYAPAYVVMVREPLETALSLLRRDGIPVEQGLLLWLDTMLAAERDTRGRRRIFITFDQLLADWRGCLGRVGGGLTSAFAPPTTACAESIERYLAPDLRHHSSPDTDASAPDRLRDMAAAAHAWFRAAAEVGEPQTVESLEGARLFLEGLRACLASTLQRQRSLLFDYVRHAHGMQALVDRLRSELGAAASRAEDLDRQLGEANQLRKIEATAFL